MIKMNCDVGWCSDKFSYAVIIRDIVSRILTCSYGNLNTDSAFVVESYAMLMKFSYSLAIDGLMCSLNQIVVSLLCCFLKLVEHLLGNVRISSMSVVLSTSHYRVTPVLSAMRPIRLLITY